jgi:arylsulfatase A-like enzyme
VRADDRTPTSMVILTLAVVSAGFDLVWAARSGRGWTVSDHVIVWAVGLALVVPFLAPALVAGVAVKSRRLGWLAWSVVLLHAAVMIRFGPLVNAPLASPPVLGAWLAVGAVCLAGAWITGPALERLPRRAWVAVGVVGLLGLPVGMARGLRSEQPPAPPPGPDAPNIVLFTLDTTRFDHLSMYGRSIDTPHLQSLADRGTTFDLAIAAAPQTGPSHLSILSGRVPITHGVVANGTNVGEQPMIARALHAAGWATGGFVAAFPVHERFSFDQGFDAFDSDFSPVVGLHELAPMQALDAVVFRNLPRERTGDQVNARALRWLAAQGDDERPFFAWIHYYDPHGPFTPPAGFHEKYTGGPPKPGGELLALPEYWPADQRAIRDVDYLTKQYDAEIAFTDTLVGEVLAALGRFERDTIIVVTADHGESLTEHGILFDHGDDLYDPALRVPLIVVGPGVRAGARHGCQTSAADVVPTVLDLAGVADGAERDGISRATELRAGGACEDVDVFSSTVGERVMDPPIDHAVRRPDVKLILKERRANELYDLRLDPGETVNLFEERRQQGEALAGVLGAKLAGGAAPRSAEGGADVRAMLEQLGYLDAQE